MQKDNNRLRHTHDIQDIVSTPPKWILRWGITVFLLLLLTILSMATFIRYPDIVKAQLTIVSPNASKPIVSKISGKIVKLLASENEIVKAGQPLAYIESTANHVTVIGLVADLKIVQRKLQQNKPINVKEFDRIDDWELGELQPTYQVFFGSYLTYLSSLKNGYLMKKHTYLQKDLENNTKLRLQLDAKKVIDERDFVLAQQEFEMHNKLRLEKVETKSEFMQEESKYLAKKSALVQTESAIIGGKDSYSSKQKEILELYAQIAEEKGKFIQALNSIISAAEDWKSKFILSASQSGKLSYAGIIQENQVVTQGQEVFVINPGNQHFFGEMSVPQNSLGKIREGQRVLIKLKGYPFEDYGIIKGKVSFVSDVPFHDSTFTAKVDLKIKDFTDLKKPIHLKEGMTADAEVVTQDATILQRVFRTFFKITGNK